MCWKRLGRAGNGEGEETAELYCYRGCRFTLCPLKGSHSSAFMEGQRDEMELCTPFHGGSPNKEDPEESWYRLARFLSFRSAFDPLIDSSPDPDEIAHNIGNWTLENEVRQVLFLCLSLSFFFIPILFRKRFSGVEFDVQINPTEEELRGK